MPKPASTERTEPRVERVDRDAQVVGEAECRISITGDIARMRIDIACSPNDVEQEPTSESITFSTSLLPELLQALNEWTFGET